MRERADREDDSSIDRDVVVLAAGYLAVLVAGGAAIALALGRSPGPFLADLFSDPVWLFGTVFGLFVLLKASSKRRAE
ncbi:MULTISPECIES: hypothetical protein [Saliphagus]|uniref:Uncharacterized protein n=1 Tax=Saliphagus infecundisoli TaxID=1849069 RepID=A0ABD5QEP9_9EURY|nr:MULTISPECIES: hypothetical protein [Saliphagus]